MATLMTYAVSYNMCHPDMQGRCYLFFLSAFPATVAQYYAQAYSEAPASTSGVGRESKVYMSILNIFEQYAHAGEKRDILNLVGAMTYHQAGFKTTKLQVLDVYNMLDHVAVTSSHQAFPIHRLEAWSDQRKIDRFVEMCDDAGQAWVSSSWANRERRVSPPSSLSLTTWGQECHCRGLGGVMEGSMLYSVWRSIATIVESRATELRNARSPGSNKNSGATNPPRPSHQLFYPLD